MSDNDDDLCIPRSAMYKLVKELVPQVRLSGEAKDLIVTACNEFIHMLAAEANTVCERQSKKVISLGLFNLGNKLCPYTKIIMRDYQNNYFGFPK